MKVSREVKTAILAIVAIAILIFGYSFLKGQNLLDSSRELYAVYDDVSGLSPSAGVTLNGLKVGGVSDISFLNDTGKILVTLSINSDFQFSNTSIAQIYSDGFIGGKSIKIVPVYDGVPAKSGDTLRSEVEASIMADVMKRLEPLQMKIESAMAGLDTLVHSLNQVLDDSTVKDLKQSMANLNVATGEISTLLSNNSKTLDTTITNLSETAYNFEKVSDSLAQIEVQPLLTKIDSVLTHFNAITEKLNNGTGTAGKLLNNDEVYVNLKHATKQLEELIQDIKLNPDRYINFKFSIFGGKDKSQPYKKPADPLK